MKTSEVSTGLTDADLQRGIQAAKRYASYVARQYKADHEDILSWAMAGVLQAWNTYNPARGASWDTHARNMISFYVKKRVRPRARSVEAASIEVVGDHAGEDFDFASSVALRTAMQALPPKDRWLIAQRYLGGRSCREISRQTGVHPMHLWRREQVILKTLRETMKSEGAAA